MTAKTTAEQLPALEALIVIGRTFAHLPAITINLSPIYPGEIVLSVHDDLAAFEQWRTALGIAEGDVDHQQRPRSTHMVLKARTTFARATVELVGYAPALPTLGAAA
ncbi:hypothetical protein [Streptomyces sp. NPDC020983]|uniref:hypothetical protein n=1 Tax=Streptomyces sp. NPDC020983 TaxID=3365106 RepID=UPI00378D0215